jgi:hypothetical protein
MVGYNSDAPYNCKLIQHIGYRIVIISMYFVDMFTFLYCTIRYCAFPGYLGVTLFEPNGYCHCAAHVFVCVRRSEHNEHGSMYHLPHLPANITCVCFIKKDLLVLLTVQDNLSTAICTAGYAASVIHNILGVLICSVCLRVVSAVR